MDIKLTSQLKCISKYFCNHFSLKKYKTPRQEWKEVIAIILNLASRYFQSFYKVQPNWPQWFQLNRNMPNMNWNFDDWWEKEFCEQCTV